MDCGCKIVGTGHQTQRDLTIEFCPLHAAAGKMQDALKPIVSQLDNWVAPSNPIYLSPDEARAILEAAKATETP